MNNHYIHGMLLQYRLEATVSLTKYIESCKCHWKEIMALSLVWHFVFDGLVLAVGVLIGMHIGHGH